MKLVNSRKIQLFGFGPFLWLSAVLGFYFCDAYAQDKSLVRIQSVQVADGDRLDVLFDKKIHESQIRMEYLNDIIQLSISDASVYPAKISSVSGKNLKKIFVYQYSPRLVRVRLTVAGRAETYQGKVHLNTFGRRLKVDMDTRSSTEKSESPSAKVEVVSSAVPVSVSRPEEAPSVTESLEKPAAPVESESIKADSLPVDLNRKVFKPKADGIAGGRESVSLGRVLVSLMGVAILFLGAAKLSRKALLKSGKGGSLSRWVQKSLGSPEKAIEVIATHHLGPNKTIHMIKVTDRTLVIGVSNESINLITELNTKPAASPIKLDDPTVAQDETFLSSLGEHVVKKLPTVGPSVTMAPVAKVTDSSVGESVPSAAPAVQPISRERLEGVG